MADKKRRKALIAMAKASTAEEMLAAAAIAGLVNDKGRVTLDRPISSKLCAVDLSLVDFHRTTFENIRFINCPAAGVTFNECRFDSCFFAAEGTGLASLRGSTFLNCSLTNTNFGAARLDLREVKFVHTNLRDCTFRFGKLAGGRFERCYLDYVMLRAADLENASFSGSTLKKVCFELSDLSTVNFEGVTFLQADFWGPLDLPGPTGG